MKERERAQKRWMAYWKHLLYNYIQIGIIWECFSKFWQADLFSFLNSNNNYIIFFFILKKIFIIIWFSQHCARIRIGFSYFSPSDHWKKHKPSAAFPWQMFRCIFTSWAQWAYALRSRRHFSRLNSSYPVLQYVRGYAPSGPSLSDGCPIKITIFGRRQTIIPSTFFFCFLLLLCDIHLTQQQQQQDTNQNKRNRVILVHDLHFISVANQQTFFSFPFLHTLM